MMQKLEGAHCLEGQQYEADLLHAARSSWVALLHTAQRRQALRVRPCSMPDGCCKLPGQGMG